MAKIVFKVQASGSVAQWVSRLRGVVSNLSIGSISAAIAADTPVFERRLFDRQDPELCTRLLALLKNLESNDVAYEAYELRDSETFDPSKKATYFKVNADRLATMIESRKQSLDRLYEAAELESDQDEGD